MKRHKYNTNYTYDSMDDRQHPNLQPGEVILFQIQSNKVIHEFRNKIMLFIFNFAYITMLSIFIYLFLTNRESVHVSSESSNIQWLFFLILPIIFGIFFIAGSLYSYGNAKNSSYAMYYFTSKRIIKFIDRSYFFHKPKEHDINYNKLSHLMHWEHSIEFVPKKITGKSYFNGREKKLRYPIQLWLHSIKLNLNDSYFKQEKLKILKIVRNHSYLEPHPLNEDLYYQ